MSFEFQGLPGRATFPVDDLINLEEYVKGMARENAAMDAAQTALIEAGMPWCRVVDVATLPLKGETWAVVTGPGLPVWRRGLEPWHYPSLQGFADAWKSRQQHR